MVHGSYQAVYLADSEQLEFSNRIGMIPKIIRVDYDWRSLFAMLNGIHFRVSFITPYHLAAPRT